ncbi:MAG TPA: LacI family DNA-binding transcriptional regulator [Lacunisphaera sp.]|nr:LacI family DNA-binding transcriptional regulator [Lacunisphaera sp.]
MNDRRVTLADIAAKAGVHVTTVSLALRNHPRLPESTRQRIHKLAEEMGYRPDPLLRALISYRGRVMERRNMPTLAYVTNWATCWGWKKVTAHPDFYAGAEAKANQLGYKLEHFWMREPGLTQGRLSRMLYSRGINGLIIASHGREMGDALQFDWQNFSAVKIDYFPHQPVLHNVTNNQCDIIRLAMQKVMAAGYRRIGFVMHRGWDHAVDHLWTAGFLCEQQNLAPRERVPAHIFPEPHPIERWFNETNVPVVVDQAALEKWLNKYQPEVVISKASFVLPVFKKLGIRVPRDVAFVDVFLEELNGMTAGVRQNHETVGAVAVEILAGQLQHNKFGVPEIPTTTYVEGTWFDGQSCPARVVAARAG